MQQLWGNGSRVAAVNFFFFSLWDSGGKSMGEDDQKDQEGLTVYRESGKNVVKGVSQDAKSN